MTFGLFRKDFTRVIVAGGGGEHYSPMRTAGPTAWPAHTLAHLIEPHGDASRPCFFFLCRCNPANPFVACEWRNAFPYAFRHSIRYKCPAKIRRHRVYLSFVFFPFHKLYDIRCWFEIAQNERAAEGAWLSRRCCLSQAQTRRCSPPHRACTWSFHTRCTRNVLIRSCVCREFRGLHCADDGARCCSDIQYTKL